MEDAALVDTARALLAPRRLSVRGAEAAGVACALRTDRGDVFTGVCIETSSSLSFCAEHVAIGAMITGGQSRIETIVAVNWNGRVLPPCGVCRELIWQVHDDNGSTRVLLPNGRVTRLAELLPESPPTGFTS